MKLMIILGSLFVALLILIPLIERHTPVASPAAQAKLSRWLLPLVAVGLVLALLRQCTGSF